MKTDSGLAVFVPRPIDLIGFPVTLKTQNYEYNSEVSMHYFRRWCASYAVTHHAPLVDEVGKVLAVATPELISAYTSDSRTRFKRPHILPHLERGTSPSLIQWAVAPDWIVIGISSMSYIELPLDAPAASHGPYWTFLFKENGLWQERWQQNAAVNGKGGIWLGDNLYFPSSRFPWPLPLQNPARYTEAGTVNAQLVADARNPLTQRLRSYRPWVRYQARKEATLLRTRREKIAPEYQ